MKYNDLQSRVRVLKYFGTFSFVWTRNIFGAKKLIYVWEITICLLSPSFHKCSRSLSFAPSSNFFSSAKRNLEILYVFGRKASDRACYRNRNREAKDFEKVYPTNWMGDTYLVPGARFSKVPIINGPVKLLLFAWKIEVSIVLHSYMIKLSVNETKWSILLARTRALILFISIPIFDFGPKKVIGTFKKRAPGPHYCARPMHFGSRGPGVVQSFVLDTSPKCIDREGLGSQEWRGSGTTRVYKVKPFNRYGKHDGIKGKNFSSRNRLSFLKFWDRSSALWHLKEVFHVISFHFDLSILVVDESYFSLLCLGLRP